MRKPRSLLFLWILPAVVEFAFAIWLNMGPKPRINHEVFMKLSSGMTIGDVEVIIGMPQGDYRTASEHVREGRSSWGKNDNLRACWIGDDGVIHINFDEDGKLNGTVFFAHKPRTILSRLRDWLW